MLAEPESKLPDECRQSDFVSLPTLLERFIASGAKYMEYMGAQGLSAEEKEALFDGVTADELADEDISVQKAFVDNVQAQLNKKEVVKEPTQPVKQVEPEKTESSENA